MPRGRHRHSPPLHRILPPSVVAGVSVVGATGAWFLAEPLVLRGLVAAVAAAALTGAYLMRSWDRAAGLRVAELTRARTRDEWRAEERIAELEQDLEESRELRTRLEAKLRRKRVELAGLRGEHAGLLRRYANAETERASALEGRRQLAIESAAPAPELTAGRSTPTPDAYRRADEALRNLSRNAARQEARRAAEVAQQLVASKQAAKKGPAQGPEKRAEEAGPQGKDAAATGADEHRQSRPSTVPPAPAPQLPAPASPLPASAAPVHVPRTVPAASAVVPYAAARRHLVPQGSFDFFGTQNGQKAKAAIESVQNEDLADVVGEEALAVHRTGAAQHRAVGKVIDLTAHDETEQIDVAELRGAVS
ncbi:MULTISPECIES: hypothetical protein [Streptomyces]|uniref:hypothetical protein n=1 Tax=Streptomyces TaxID=1883 RepID=UPI0013F49F07|nr:MULTISPECIES: hypothetical protein [Streptomyces]MBT3077462.1 hypothetical protein [Streptomyces sp. COG21]MBT3082787.1 hypothetical protein [Streptomyces sp. COG20]MBT3087608.1 hypothetical protein [Streptomyces sp. CYG21]MBT3097360.1 hypothetical protein [Streptomyces sp. CBG30]MBT3104760.1 hypothetical protein [Streptomyces sp. COG19]